MTADSIPLWNRIATRLGASFALLCLGLLGTGLGGQWLNNRTQAEVASSANAATQTLVEVDHLKTELLLAGGALRDSGLSGDAQEVLRLLNLYKTHWAAFQSGRKALASQPLSAESQAALTALGALEEKAHPVLQRTVSLAAGLAGEAVKVVLLESFSPLQNQMLQALETLNQHVIQHSEHTMARAFEQARKAGMWAIVLSASLCLFGGVMALHVIRSVTRPLAQAHALAASVAQGDLTTTVEHRRNDEMGQLMRSLHSMRDRLVEMLAEVQGSATSIANASAEIAQCNVELSSRTEMQAARLQQTAATTQHLVGTVAQNTSRAQDADGLAQGSKGAADQGQSVIGQAMGTMHQIQAASSRIAEINQVIDGLAFQTNILALNAAVEAARAGQQGRSFAVVASEVRSLAQRSATAAKEIRVLIDGCRQAVEAGAERVKQAGSVVNDMTTGVGRVSGLISEIAHASHQQREGFDSVRHGIGELETFTQQNAALVDEVSATAGSLSQQTQTLAALVAKFRLPVASA
jgi:methyl-accepting chemotaxis protein